jgi:hypothetical protein
VDLTNIDDPMPVLIDLTHNDEQASVIDRNQGDNVIDLTQDDDIIDLTQDDSVIDLTQDHIVAYGLVGPRRGALTIQSEAGATHEVIDLT